jgi:hypothetical protein
MRRFFGCLLRWRFWVDYDESDDGGNFGELIRKIVLIRLLAQSTEVEDDKIYDSFRLGSWCGFWVKITTELGDRAVNKMESGD